MEALSMPSEKGKQLFILLLLEKDISLGYYIWFQNNCLYNYLIANFTNFPSIKLQISRPNIKS